MMYAFGGFSQKGVVRVLQFEALPRVVDAIARKISVDTDLARKYGIPLQELPRLCMALLNSETPHATTYAEADMKTYQQTRLEAAASAKMRRFVKPKRVTV